MFVVCQAKNLVLVLATFTPTTGAYKEVYISFTAKNGLLLKRTPYIYYLFYFKKEQGEVQVLLDFSQKIKIIIPAYILHLSLKIRPTNVGAQKINSFTF